MANGIPDTNQNVHVLMHIYKIYVKWNEIHHVLYYTQSNKYIHILDDYYYHSIIVNIIE